MSSKSLGAFDAEQVDQARAAIEAVVAWPEHVIFREGVLDDTTPVLVLALEDGDKGDAVLAVMMSDALFSRIKPVRVSEDSEEVA